MDSSPENTFTPTSAIYSADMLQAIGGLFLACSTAETILRLILTNLHHPKGGASYNSNLLLMGMEAGVMMEKIVVGTMTFRPENRAEIAANCDKIRAIFQRRNEIAHNCALLGGGDALRLTIGKVSSTGKVTREKTFHTKQIIGFANDLYLQVRRLSERVNELGITPLPELLELIQPLPE